METDKSSDKLVEMLWEFIRMEQYESALIEIRKATYSKYICDNSLEIIPVITAIANEDFFNSKGEKCLEGILIEIAQQGNPKELIIAFLEQLEKYTSISMFIVFLKPLGHILKNMPSNGKICSWLLEILNDKILSFELPLDYVFDKEKNSLANYDMDSLRNKNMLADMLEQFIEFYYNVFPSTNVIITVKTTTLVDIDLPHYLMLLFGRPLVYVLFDKNDKFYSLAHKLILMIKMITGNILFCIKHIKSSAVAASETKDDGIKFLPQLAISSFIYCVTCLDDDVNLMPQVYNPLYLYYSFIPLCINLLTEEKQIPQFKGIQLTNHLLHFLPNNTLNLDTYEVPNLLNLSKSIIAICLYSHNEKLRKLSFESFKLYYKKFDKLARVCLIQHILDFYQHAGLHSVVIHEFKEILADNFNHKCCILVNNDYCNTLLKCCLLMDCEATDILESSDRIIAVLNLLIFLSIRDRENISGWKLSLPVINEDFIEPLLNGLRCSRGHYELRLKDKSSKTDSAIHKSHNKDFVSDDMADGELTMILSALNCFDLIASLVLRFNTLLNNI